MNSARVAIVMWTCGAALASANSLPKVVAPLSQKEWAPMGMVTALHAVSNKRAGLELRLIEADGSRSVALDPVALFVVATDQDTTDRSQHIWRLPRTVARVRKVWSTVCGMDIAVDVDKPGSSPGAVRQRPLTLKTCFLDAKGQLESNLQMSEEAPVETDQHK